MRRDYPERCPWIVSTGNIPGKAFGIETVLHIRVADSSLCDEETLAGGTLPFLAFPLAMHVSTAFTGWAG